MKVVERIKRTAKVDVKPAVDEIHEAIQDIKKLPLPVQFACDTIL